MKESRKEQRVIVLQNAFLSVLGSCSLLRDLQLLISGQLMNITINESSLGRTESLPLASHSSLVLCLDIVF